MHPRRRCLRVTRAVVLLSAIGIAAFAGANPAAAGDASVVRTQHGLLRGAVGGGVRLFQAIPYAAPPVGALRWAPPGPVPSWRGVRDATKPAPACAQAASVLSGRVSAGGSTTEDCLFLNVFTPERARGPLPVMVWIHGGGFTSGAAGDYDATALTTRGPALVVTINYRLGPFGFLALPGLSSEARDHSSGNFGLQDQQSALRWVRANILAFGGNPFDVTVFGESAGGLSVCAQLASPTAARLFERAITESGPCAATLPALATAETTGSAFAARVGCAGPAGQVACLRALPVSAVLAGGTVGGPNVGGAILPRQIPAAISSGSFNRVPVMEGTNHDEDRLFVALQFDLAGRPVTAAQYPALIAAQFGAAASSVLAQYPLAAFANPSLALATVVTDSRFACGARLADRLLSAAVPTFAYEFNDPNAPEFLVQDPVMPLGAFHASELAYLFPPPGVSILTPQQAALADQMARYWTRFAATGSPNAPGSPRWVRFTSANDRFQSLAPTSTGSITTFAADHRCAFWASLTGA
jgi:para-nitrobenzyl esterase